MEDFNGNSKRPAGRVGGGDAPRSQRGRLRAERIAEKRMLRQRGRAAAPAIPFAEMVNDPLYRRIEAITCPEDLTAEVSALRLDSAARVGCFTSLPGLREHLSPGRNREAPEPTPAFFARARRQAVRSYRLRQHALAVNDPMNQALRHTSSGLSSAGGQALFSTGQAYAKPSSLQSSQSLAAYLRHLYRIATGRNRDIGIHPAESVARRLDSRRPDLADLVLSETHLKQEVPTVQLVSEVLQTGLGEVDLSAPFYPIALPFHEPAERTRAALASIGGTTLDDVFARVASDFPLRAGFRLAGDQAGLLGLTGALDQPTSKGNELALLTETGDITSNDWPSTLEDLYGTADNLQACRVSRLLSGLDLDFDGLVQLLGLYPVQQENGDPVLPKQFATVMLDNEHDPRIEERGSERYVLLEQRELAPPLLRSLHYLARLHHGTGLAFHHLNWILAVPGASLEGNLADPASNQVARRHVSATGLRVLASYPVYREAFGLGPEAYAALFGEICPFWRVDTVAAEGKEAVAGLEQTERSFFREIFGDDSPELHRTIRDEATPITDRRLGTMVSRGLGLSTVEFEALVTALNPSFGLKTRLDARGLAAVYRLRTVFRMLGWPLLTGLRLSSLVSRQATTDDALWTWLTAKNVTPADTDRLCTALDWLVGLAKWTQEAELSPETLLALLTRTEPTAASVSHADRDWLNSLTLAVAPALVGADTFGAFLRWDEPGDKSLEVTGEAWNAHLTGAEGLYRPSGVFHTGQDREAVHAACRDCLTTHFAVDLGIASNEARLQRLVAQLERARDAQAQTLERLVPMLGVQLSAASTRALLRWAQGNPLDTLDALLAGPDEPEARFWVSELRRHVATVDALGLGDIDLLLIGERPTWLNPDIADTRVDPPLPKPLDLLQLYSLSRFEGLQVGAATDSAWLGYLAMARDGRPESDASPSDQAAWRETCAQTLGVLLGCPAADAKTYLDALFGPDEVASDLRRVAAVACRARLAGDLCFGAAELLALERVSNSDVSGDWTAAAAAAQAGLARFSRGSHEPALQSALAEKKRDALVAAYLQLRVAADADLAAQVTNREALYSHLLLDVDVTSSVPTSRLVEAASALQLYISRALNGLEGVEFMNRDALVSQWKVDKSYRQWEANQKLLLYPQNYIEPELRQITSPEFDELLQAVSGNDVSEDSVETAINAYMAGLASCCDLSLCSLFVDRDSDHVEPGNAIYHLLAASKTEQGRYFYRKLEADFKTISELPSQYLKALDWTYWQEVVIPTTHEMFSDVAVCFFQNRYFFFWLELEERKTQSPEGEAVSWRIHPRYMRCDANALTGTMRTPGLFIEGTAAENANMAIDGAFVWTGPKPAFSGAFHPRVVWNTSSYGVLAPGIDDDGACAVAVLFGIDLAEAGSEGATPTIHGTTLQMRLTPTWSDAIFRLQTPMQDIFTENSPVDFKVIRPVPKYVVQVEPSAGADFSEQIPVGIYEFELPDRNRFVVHNTYSAPSTAAATYIPSASPPTPSAEGNNELGSIAVDIDLGKRIYKHRFIKTSAGASANTFCEALKELAPTEISIRYDVQYRWGDDGFATTLGTSVTHSTPRYEVDSLGIHSSDSGSKEIPHLSSEPFSSVLPIRRDLFLGEVDRLRISVDATVTRRFHEMDLSGRSSSSGSAQPLPWSCAAEPTQAEPEFKTRVGELDLRIISEKLDTAWVSDGVRTGQSFLHIATSPMDSLDETFLLLSSSSALSDLAQSMPQPGGVQGLFTSANQSLTEDMGTFVRDLADELQKIYPSDTTTIAADRTPSLHFDFDAAYGGYGWEVFYHIPSAVAAGYENSGQHDSALDWLRKIYDPRQTNPWQVGPMKGALAPAGELAFDTGEAIVDPDRIAVDYPFYYQQATLRHYLELLISAGDAAYEQRTQESLQQAKATYVEAKQLFRDNLLEALEVLTNQSWRNPKLSEASEDDGAADFLPPYNEELRALYDTIEARLSNLRQWLDIDGEPLRVPLLAASIDPRVLQRAAKASMALGSTEYEGSEERESLIEFPTVLRSAKGYVANLKTTSARLQAAREKLDDKRISRIQRNLDRRKVERASAVQGLAVAAAAKDVAIKKANLASASNALALHVGKVLTRFVASQAANARAAGELSWFLRTKVFGWYSEVNAKAKSALPNTFGMATGGQNFEQGSIASLLGQISGKMDKIIIKSTATEVREAMELVLDTTAQTGELSSKVASAALELQKTELAFESERMKHHNLEADIADIDTIKRAVDSSFANVDFYEWLTADLELLFAEEWSATQDFCRLLVKLYDDETNEANGASFLRTTTLGGTYQQLNAPHRLALDLERLEAAYVRSLAAQRSQRSSVRFALSELPSAGSEASALTALVEHGETYFELTEEMFDTLYPGQYDRRIQSLGIRFPGLAKAGLSPHARLTQIGNTRYVTRERDPQRGAKMRKDRYALQSIVLGAPEVDTAAFDYPEGLLKCFQNTGVESRWRLELPTVLELKRRAGNGRCRAWRDTAARHFERLRSHLDEIEFEVTFSGRW